METAEQVHCVLIRLGYCRLLGGILRSALVHLIGVSKDTWMGDEHALSESMLDVELHAVRFSSESSIGTSMMFAAHAVLLSTALEAVVAPSNSPDSSNSTAKASLKGSPDSISRLTVESLFMIGSGWRTRRDW